MRRRSKKIFDLESNKKGSPTKYGSIYKLNKNKKKNKFEIFIINKLFFLIWNIQQSPGVLTSYVNGTMDKII